MRFVDEFRDPAAARALVRSITSWPAPTSSSSWRCAAATPTPSTGTASSTCCPNVELVHGPGCPVCVIPMGRVDDAMWLAEQPDVIFTCFGDMMRVPGSNGSLIDAKARGADVRFVYSPLDALKFAVDNPDKQVVFFALGFETTAPSTAVTLVRAREMGLRNFSVFCNHVTIVPPIKAILESPDLRLSGFLGPGHVSTVVGLRPTGSCPRSTASPSSWPGSSRWTSSRRCTAAAADPRGPLRGGEPVHPRGPPRGQHRGVEADGPDVRAAAALRVAGLGFISQSALKVHPDYAEFDAEGSRCPACGWPTPRPASAARC